MTDCKGWIGRMFGHSFQKIVTEKCPLSDVEGFQIKAGWTGMSRSDVAGIIENLRELKYKIICVRCGQELKEATTNESN